MKEINYNILEEEQEEVINWNNQIKEALKHYDKEVEEHYIYVIYEQGNEVIDYIYHDVYDNKKAFNHKGLNANHERINKYSNINISKMNNLRKKEYKLYEEINELDIPVKKKDEIFNLLNDFLDEIDNM